MPDSVQVRRFFEYSAFLASQCESELEWFEGIKERAINWLD